MMMSANALFGHEQDGGYLVEQGNKSESECKTLLWETLRQQNSLLAVFYDKLLEIFKERKEPNYNNLGHCHDDILMALWESVD